MRQGATAILPLAFGAAVYGFAFGVLAAQVGFPWWGVATMSALVHAGSSQIVAVEQFAGGAGVLGGALAGAALNLRYLGIVASLAGVLQGASFPMRLAAIHLTGDENWALTMAERAKDPKIGLAFLLGSGCVMISFWTVSTALGAAVGAVLPDLERFGLGFAFTAAFIAMARGMYRGRSDILPWIIAFTAASLAALSGVPTAYAVVLGTLSGLAAIITRKIGAPRAS